MTISQCRYPKQKRKRNPLWQLGGFTPWQLTKSVFQGSLEDGLIDRASALAFDFFLALFPLLVFLLSLFGLFTSHGSQLQGSLFAYVADFLPPTVFEMVCKITEEVVTNAGGGKLTFGVLVALWIASGGVASMISTLNVVYRVREGRSWLKVQAISLGLTLVLSLLTLGVLLILFLGGKAMDWAGV